jgi:hypothetical protein
MKKHILFTILMIGCTVNDTFTVQTKNKKDIHQKQEEKDTTLLTTTTMTLLIITYLCCIHDQISTTL